MFFENEDVYNELLSIKNSIDKRLYELEIKMKAGIFLQNAVNSERQTQFIRTNVYFTKSIHQL